MTNVEMYKNYINNVDDTPFESLPQPVNSIEEYLYSLCKFKRFILEQPDHYLINIQEAVDNVTAADARIAAIATNINNLLVQLNSNPLNVTFEVDNETGDLKYQIQNYDNV